MKNVGTDGAIMPPEMVANGALVKLLMAGNKIKGAEAGGLWVMLLLRMRS